MAHPGPAKAEQFRTVDLASLDAALAAALQAGAAHIVYLSVAQPAPVMRAYVAARAEGEARLARAGLPATALRPWYVLGPGHRWPYALLPFYALASLVPATREAARRLRPVRLAWMTAALVAAVEDPPPCGLRVVEAAAIRAAGCSAAWRRTLRCGPRPSPGD